MPRQGKFAENYSLFDIPMHSGLCLRNDSSNSTSELEENSFLHDMVKFIDYEQQLSYI